MPHVTPHSYTMSYVTPCSNDDSAGVCPDCHCKRLIASDQGGYVCAECGLVQEQITLANDDDPRYNLFFNMPDVADEETTILAQFNKSHYVAHDKGLQSMKRYRQRFLEIKLVLETAARALGMTMGPDGDTERAFFLFKQVKGFMDWRFGAISNRLAIACLFLTSKERNRGFSITEVAIKANMMPSKIGAMYRKVLRALLDNDIITMDHPCFKTETDPWLMLERLILLGHKNDSRGVDLASLPPAYRRVLGVGMEDTEKIRRIRHIMALAAKCLALALDSTQGDPRMPEATVAACVGVAVQIELKAIKVDDSFWNVMVGFFYANLRTTLRRRADLRIALQRIASQNLILARNARFINHCDKFAYFAEDVLKYWVPQSEQLRDKIRSFREPTICAKDGSDGSSDDSGDEADQRIGERPPRVLAAVPTSGSIDGNARQQHSEGGMDALQMLYPPSFMKAQERRAARACQLQEAQKQLSADLSNTPPSSGASPAPSDFSTHGGKPPTFKERLSAVRVQWMKQLLASNYKTPSEIEEASDSVLEYWMEQIKSSSADQAKRSEEELNSREPSEKDLSHCEINYYLRRPEEVEAARKVLQPMYDAYEAEKRRREISKAMNKRTGHAVGEGAGRVKRQRTALAETKGSSALAHDQGGQDGPGGQTVEAVRPRSALINWAALERLEQEGKCQV